jgi:hypothetical protein
MATGQASGCEGTEMKRKTCGDCHVLEGQYHVPGCDVESCPFCGKQLISCDCRYEKLGIDVSPGAFAYENGLTDEQEERWDQMLKDKGLIPFIEYPNMCVKCGELWPEMFQVSGAEWRRYIEPRQRDKMLCRRCYDQIKAWIDRP